MIDEDLGATNRADELDEARGAEAAALIWDDDPKAELIVDPRNLRFAHSVLDALSTALGTAPGALRRAIRTAAKSASGLNVEPFQGLVEVVQNADDLRAQEVRFGLREGEHGKEMLIVHDGKPVTCQHVLAMVIPYFTTKEDEVDQRGRFGIGLKTLARISTSMQVHSHPYHFGSDQVMLARVDEEPAIAGFYEPGADTMIVLRLKKTFSEDSLRAWFEEWHDDGLIFLASVRRFCWCDPGAAVISEKAVEPGEWEKFDVASLGAATEAIVRRQMRSGDRTWDIFKARVRVPEDQYPAHKARSETTYVSVAMAAGTTGGHLHVGFRTRIPVTIPVSIDGQFDPSTTREEMVEDDWNTWLIGQCGSVLGDVAKGLMASDPVKAWRVIPSNGEAIGNEDDRWLRGAFEDAFEACRESIRVSGEIYLSGTGIALANVAYEKPELTGLLTTLDVELLADKKRALPAALRDDEGRWRKVLDQLGVSKSVGTDELLAGFSSGLFGGKATQWWVAAAEKLTSHHSDAALFGVPFWRSTAGTAVSCQKAGASSQRLVFGSDVSPFALRWQLLDRLDDAYGESPAGEAAIRWLNRSAAFTTTPGATEELEAFAERYATAPVEVDDAALREIRDRFDQLSDKSAEATGRHVGAALLLDGFTHKGGKPAKAKVRPTDAYLCKTLDADNPNWPVAVGNLSGIQWIAARYEDQLKTGSGRGERRRGDDGMISRGPRRFLMLLGAECAPRLVEMAGGKWGGGTRDKELTAAGANEVKLDYASPHLDVVLEAFAKMSVKERKVRSPALFRALSRNWARLYGGRLKVASGAMARTIYHEKGEISALWLCRLKDVAWVAIGKGELSRPSLAVVRSAETQTLYPSSSFLLGLESGDIHSGMTLALEMRTDVRVSDILGHLGKIRQGEVPSDENNVLQLYRNLARLCPKTVVWGSRVGDVLVPELRRRFGEGRGLIYAAPGDWRRPDEMLRGADIFHDRKRFVPGGPGCAALWATLAVPEPALDACITFCRSLSAAPYDGEAIGKLIDVYRYMEPRLSAAEKRHRERLRGLPLGCAGEWKVDRPIFFVESAELREQFIVSQPKMRFWTPPCDTRDLPRLVSMVGLTRTSPVLTAFDDRESATNQGESMRAWFARAVNHLSDELARNDLSTREKLRISWDELRAMPLFVYDHAPLFKVRDDAISPGSMRVNLRSLLTVEPLELHIWLDALPEREHGGRAIASLFAPDVRRKIEAEWVVAWMAGKAAPATGMRLASDEAHLDSLREEADKINAAPKTKISVTPQSNKFTGPVLPPRTLKESVGIISGATAHAGSPQKIGVEAKPKLSTNAPAESGTTGRSTSRRPTAYSLLDVEQVGWDVVRHLLNTWNGAELVDFRKRHGVGADGAFDWTRFVELKATAGGPATSVEVTVTEYERAKTAKNDYILALVSGLEAGETCQVRLIFDPAHRASYTPTGGVRFFALNDAPSIVVSFSEGHPTGADYGQSDNKQYDKDG